MTWCLQLSEKTKSFVRMRVIDTVELSDINWLTIRYCYFELGSRDWIRQWGLWQ